VKGACTIEGRSTWWCGLWEGKGGRERDISTGDCEVVQIRLDDPVRLEPSEEILEGYETF
jgi:hypothetical protein